MTDEPKKIIVDDDWKQQAKKEKEKLTDKAEESQQYEMPPANFMVLINSFAMQAMVCMGVIANPMTGQQEKDFEAAKHYIDLLAVLEEKTKGNLTEEENKSLSLTLHDLRMAYVQVNK